ncbi:MAG: tetratricopeptide repeat protein [Chloroflexi bacterium]|nr:tetratricopeptide repeat protein [Chloroflexota bacterium]MCY4247687.1 tetratricopeptide repeat protein [Chloroflexota bacterium]
MAVISELIDSGLRLKRQRRLRGAIEHFRQLHATYPDNARIQFELANCWLAFGTPENALPHYRELLALPQTKTLPPKDMPRLYAQLCATLHQLGEHAEALEIAQAGLQLHPDYRPLRAWQIFALDASGAQQVAVLNALELMLESLAPSRWDIFEEDIKQAVRQMRARLENAPTAALPEMPKTGKARADSVSKSTMEKKQQPDSPEQSGKQRINLSGGEEAEADAGEHEVAVVVRPPARKPSRRRSLPQLGKRSVRIDISSGDDKAATDDPPASAAVKIPIDD